VHIVAIPKLKIFLNFRFIVPKGGFRHGVSIGRESFRSDTDDVPAVNECNFWESHSYSFFWLETKGIRGNEGCHHDPIHLSQWQCVAERLLHAILSRFQWLAVVFLPPLLGYS
jgi:hypothetical protein